MASDWSVWYQGRLWHLQILGTLRTDQPTQQYRAQRPQCWDPGHTDVRNGAGVSDQAESSAQGHSSLFGIRNETSVSSSFGEEE